MFIAILLLNVLHPGRVLVGPESEFPSLTRKQKKELKRVQKEEKRRIKEEKKMTKDKRKKGYVEGDVELLEADRANANQQQGRGSRREPWV
jgi:hypothetical protein